MTITPYREYGDDAEKPYCLCEAAKQRSSETWFLSVGNEGGSYISGFLRIQQAVGI